MNVETTPGFSTANSNFKFDVTLLSVSTSMSFKKKTSISLIHLRTGVGDILLIPCRRQINIDKVYGSLLFCDVWSAKQPGVFIFAKPQLF